MLLQTLSAFYEFNEKVDDSELVIFNGFVLPIIAMISIPSDD